MIKWEREHHQRKEEEKPTLFAEDAGSMHIMRERNIVPPAALVGPGGEENSAGKNERKLWSSCHCFSQ